MKKAFLFIYLSIFVTSLVGQNILRGKVIDAADEQALIGANIILLEDLSIGTSTDINGEFELSFTPNLGEVEFLFQYIGYNEQLKIVDPKNLEYLEIRLESTPMEIEPVTISATKSIGEEFVVKEISKLDIYTNPNARADPLRAVNSLPASTTTDEAANLSLRGSPASETGFVLNRVPIDDAFKLDQANGIGQFSIFNTSIISKVDVYPSNPPLEFGGSSSGLISMYTDEFSSSNSKSINLTMAGAGFKIDHRLNHKNTLIAFANYSFEPGLKSINKVAFDNLESFSSFDAGNYWVSIIDEKSKLKVFNYTLLENYEYKVSMAEYVDISTQNKKRNQSIINYERQIGRSTNLDINQGINFSNSKYAYGNSQHEINKRDLFSSLNLSRFGDFYSLRIGVSGDFHFIESSGQYPEYYWANSPEFPSIPYDNEVAIYTPEFYAYNKLRFSEKFVVSFANRKTVAASENVGSLSADQVNISYDIKDEHNVKLSFGDYYKVITPGEQFYETTIVESKHYSLDYRFQKNKWLATAALYAKRSKYGEENLNIKGLEVFIAYENQKLKSSLSCAHVDSNIEIIETIYPSQNDLTFFIRHLLKYKISDDFELNSSLFLRSGSYRPKIESALFHTPTETYQPVYENLENMSRLPTYSLWDLSISKFTEIGDGVLIAFFSASNALNRKNVSGLKYDAELNVIGEKLFSRRVLFMGCVYNW